MNVYYLWGMKTIKYDGVLNLRVTKDTKQLVNSIAKFSKRKPSDVAREALEKGLKS